jgi:hypothetical protein
MMYLERVGRQTLIACAIMAAIAGVFYVSRAPAQPFAFDPQKQQPGRFQIVMHPQFRGDQYLLDTTTGQVWQLTKFTFLDGEPIAWSPMEKIDTDADRRAFYAKNRPPPPDAPTSPAPPSPKLPKASGAPKKLSPMD